MSVFATLAFLMSVPATASADPLPPVETYEFLSDKDDRCIRSNDADCDQMSEPRLFRGTWRSEFEGSILTPLGKINCEDPKSDVECIWLEGETLPWAGKADCRAYELEFVGRRYLYRGFRGMGQPFEVIADRLISAKRLPNPEGPQCSGE